MTRSWRVQWFAKPLLRLMPDKYIISKTKSQKHDPIIAIFGNWKVKRNLSCNIMTYVLVILLSYLLTSLVKKQSGSMGTNWLHQFQESKLLTLFLMHSYSMQMIEFCWAENLEMRSLKNQNNLHFFFKIDSNELN